MIHRTSILFLLQIFKLRLITMENEPLFGDANVCFHHCLGGLEERRRQGELYTQLISLYFLVADQYVMMQSCMYLNYDSSIAFL